MRRESYTHAGFGTTNTGTLPSTRTSDVWLPKNSFLRPRRPCEAMTIRSQPGTFAVSMIAVAGAHWEHAGVLQPCRSAPTWRALHRAPCPRGPCRLRQAIDLLLRRNPSRAVSAPIVDRQRFRHGDDRQPGVQGLRQGNAILGSGVMVGPDPARPSKLHGMGREQISLQ